MTYSTIIRFFFVFLFSFAISASFAKTVTSQADANWNNAGTWDLGVPEANDDVIIIHEVGITSAIEIVNNVTVKSSGTNSGTLSVNSGIVFQINGTFTIEDPEGTGIPTTNFAGNTIAIGDASDDNFIITGGGQNSFTSSTLDVGGYFHHTGGSVTIDQTNTFNISTKGSITGNVNFWVSEETSYKLPGSPEFIVNIKNQSTDTVEVYIDLPASVPAYEDKFNVNFIPDPPGSATDYKIVTELGFNKLTGSVGDGNNLILKALIPDTDLQFGDIDITTGGFALFETSQVAITNNFNCTAVNQSIVIDGALNVATETILTGSNITGDGLVTAAKYPAAGTQTIFGLGVSVYEDGKSIFGGTWRGSFSSAWNDANNWYNGIPRRKTLVQIGDRTTGASPNLTNYTTTVRGITLGASQTLTIGTNGNLTINRPGNTNGDYKGDLEINNSCNIVVNGGTLAVERDILIEFAANFSASNGGTVNVSRNVNTKANSTLNLSEGSTMTIGQ